MLCGGAGRVCYLLLGELHVTCLTFGNRSQQKVVFISCPWPLHNALLNTTLCLSLWKKRKEGQRCAHLGHSTALSIAGGAGAGERLAEPPASPGTRHSRGEEASSDQGSCSQPRHCHGARGPGSSAVEVVKLVMFVDFFFFFPLEIL